MGCSLVPIADIGNSNGLDAGDISGNDHGLVTGQHGLAERHNLADLVDDLDCTSAINAVRLIRERLLSNAVIALQTTVLPSS